MVGSDPALRLRGFNRIPLGCCTLLLRDLGSDAGAGQQHLDRKGSDRTEGTYDGEPE
jgi:hypothetical protein